MRWFRETLEDVFIPYEFKNEKGKKEKGQVQLIPREVKLYELVYPEDQHDKVLGLLKDGYKKYKILHGLKKYLAKILGLKTLSKKERAQLGKYPVSKNVGIHIIGTKKDKFKDGVEQL